jgi:hypothetical protein
MEKVQSRSIWGILLIVGGLFLLLQTLNLVTFQWLGSLFGFLLFAAAGVAFTLLFLNKREQWWALIPGCVFFSLAALVGLDSVAPRLGAAWGGPIFLGGISLAFWLIYLIHREHWWALIPGGVLLTLAAVAGLDQLAPAWETGSIFFLGLAATFLLVYLAPAGKERINWALIPAAVFLLLSIVVWGALTTLLNYLVPLALILIGLFLIWRNYTADKVEQVKSGK